MVVYVDKYKGVGYLCICMSHAQTGAIIRLGHQKTYAGPCLPIAIHNTAGAVCGEKESIGEYIYIKWWIYTALGE